MSRIILTVESINEAIKPGNSFTLDPKQLAIVKEATIRGYIKRLSHTQAQWTDKGLIYAQLDLRTKEQNKALADLFTVKVIRLADLKLIPLSTQLSRITGDSYNTTDFKNALNIGLSAESGNHIVHIKTGLMFLIP